MTRPHQVYIRLDRQRLSAIELYRVVAALPDRSAAIVRLIDAQLAALAAAASPDDEIAMLRQVISDAGREVPPDASADYLRGAAESIIGGRLDREDRASGRLRMVDGGAAAVDGEIPVPRVRGPYTPESGSGGAA